MRCFVVAGFLLTSASRGPNAIAEPLVLYDVILSVDIEMLIMSWRLRYEGVEYI